MWKSSPTRLCASSLWVIGSLCWPSPRPQSLRDLPPPLRAHFWVLRPLALAGCPRVQGCHFCLHVVLDNAPEGSGDPSPAARCFSCNEGRSRRLARLRLVGVRIVGHLAVSTRVGSGRANCSWNCPALPVQRSADLMTRGSTEEHSSSAFPPTLAAIPDRSHRLTIAWSSKGRHATKYVSSYKARCQQGCTPAV